MNKLVASGVAALGIATGSMAIATLVPLGVAGAQTDSGSTATAEAAPTRRGHLAAALDALVTDGTITQAQADAISAKVQSLRPADGERGGRMGKGGVAGAAADEVAAVLGITVEQLQTQLQGGATLRSLAGDKVAELTSLLTTKANARIDEQLAAGRIDQAKADALKAGVAAKVEATLDRAGSPGGPRGGAGRGGHGARANGSATTTPSSTSPSNTTGGA
jgi:hypothetical protein